MPPVEPSGADFSGTAYSITSEEPVLPKTGLEGTTAEQSLVISREVVQDTDETSVETVDDIEQSSVETSVPSVDPSGDDVSGTANSTTASVESNVQPEAESTTNAPGCGSGRPVGFFAVPFVWLLALK